MDKYNNNDSNNSTNDKNTKEEKKLLYFNKNMKNVNGAPVCSARSEGINEWEHGMKKWSILC